jgi:cation diffusion facilitator CzcD-associated flavoprotein CzcO
MIATEPRDLDVAIIGGGISGINMAYRVQEGLPDAKYAIFEGRGEMGGTWSLFKYPGIRSDSDLFTFGFNFDPWTKDNAIADAPSILEYLKTIAAKYGIDQNIKYHHHVDKLNWSSEQQRWQIDCVVNGSEHHTYYARNVCMGTGYYDYNEPLAAEIPNLKNFKGTVVHPQFWPENLDYADKKVVIIGSGATAVTILPAMNEKAKSVTMLQRSPGYFFAPPEVEQINLTLKKYLPAKWAHQLIRWRMMLLGYVFFAVCRFFPNFMRKVLHDGANKLMPPNVKLEKPTYDPWKQRMCITPGGDFFEALRTGKSDIVTDTISTVTETGITCSSGKHIDADIIITATGLKIQLMGHATLSVDNVPIKVSDKFVWKGAMLQDVPNLAFVFGYTNASWTLGADATARLFVRIIKNAREQGVTSVVPTMGESENVNSVTYLNLNSTYIKSAIDRGVLPRSGDKGPWVPRSNYFRDYWNARWGNVKNGLVMKRVVTD